MFNKSLSIFMLLLGLLTLQVQAQFTPTFGTLAADDYLTVNRKYFTVSTNALNDGQAYMMSSIEMATEMAKAAAGVAPYISAGTTYTPTTLTCPQLTSIGGVALPTARFKITRVNYSPIPCNGKNLRMIIVRPNDTLSRPCIMISHGKGANFNNYLTFLWNGTDYLMRGYVVAFYENSEAMRVEQYSDLHCTSLFWPNLQPKVYQGYQYAVAATKYMKANNGVYKVDRNQFFASGVSFGSICSMMLAYVDTGNFSSFASLSSFDAKTAPACTTQVVNDIKCVAAIATAITDPSPSMTTNNIGNIFDTGDANTSCLFIHGRNDNLFDITTTNYPGDLNSTSGFVPCSQAGVKVETPLALINRMRALGIPSKALIHCDASHLSITPSTFIPNLFFNPSDSLLAASGIDFGTNPNNTFATKTADWFAMLYMMSQTWGYANVICQHFKAKITPGYAPAAPSSSDGVDGVRPTDANFFWPFFTNGALVNANCGYNAGGFAYRVKSDISTEIAVYPNPTTGKITIEGWESTTQEGMCKMEIYNILGEKVWSIETQAESVDADISAYPSGIYFLSITDPKGSNLIRKIVKE